MPDILTLTCPTCGGKLQITPDIDRFACTHCGNEHIVKRSEGLVALQPLAASLSGLQRATDRAAAELALRRANEELAAIEARHSAASQALASAHLTLEQGRRRRRGWLLAGALSIGTAVCCVAGLVIPMLSYYAAAGQNTANGPIEPVSGPMAGLACAASGLGLLLLVLAVVVATRALRVPQPALSSGQAAQAAAAAQAEVSASAAALQAKQAEIDELRRATAHGQP